MVYPATGMEDEFRIYFSSDLMAAMISACRARLFRLREDAFDAMPDAFRARGSMLVGGGDAMAHFRATVKAWSPDAARAAEWLRQARARHIADSVTSGRAFRLRFLGSIRRDIQGYGFQAPHAGQGYYA